MEYKEDTANLFEHMVNSMKKHAGEMKTLGRSKSDKIGVEEADSILKENQEAFAALGLKKEEEVKFDGRY